jgi:hypothetical protein
MVWRLPPDYRSWLPTMSHSQVTPVRERYWPLTVTWTAAGAEWAPPLL